MKKERLWQQETERLRQVEKEVKKAELSVVHSLASSMGYGGKAIPPSAPHLFGPAGVAPEEPNSLNCVFPAAP